MVQDDRGFGKRTRELNYVVELHIVKPRLERQPEPMQVREPLAEPRFREHVRSVGGRAHRRIRVADAMTDAAESRAGCH
jgi:hypothetical protein